MPYLKKIKLVVIFLFIFVGPLSAQIYPSRHIGTIDGLPNNHIESIFKDSRGILWVGTLNGVSKIENGKIQNFYTSNGLAHNSAWDIVEDQNNTIWIASYGGGITKFDGVNFSIFNVDNGLVHNFVRKLAVFKKRVFVGTDDGISIINTTNDSISTINTEEFSINDIGAKNFQVMDFFVQNNEIYCGTHRHGIFKVDIENNSLKRVFSFKNNLDALFSIYKKDSIIYYGLDGATTKLTKGSFKKFKIEKLLKDEKEELIFGKSIFWNYATDHKNNLYGAAWGVHGNNGGIFQIKNDSLINRSADFGVESSNVKTLFFDAKFNFLYVGTIDKGIYEVDLNETIKFFKNKNLNIVDLDASNSELVFLTKNGLKIVKNDKINFQLSSAEFLEFSNKYYLKNPTKVKHEYSYLRNKDDADEVLFYKVLIKNNHYWVSSNIGLFQLDLSLKIKSYFPIFSKEFEFDFQDRLLNQIPYGNMKVFSNLLNYRNNSNLNTYEVENFPINDSIIPENVNDILKIKGKVYIASRYKGLFIYENQKFTSLFLNGAFSELEINHLTFSEALNQLVVATTSGELYFVDISNGFEVLNKIESGLIKGHTILGMDTYKDRILIGTNEGLLIYKNEVFQFIDHDQGLVKHYLTSGKIVGDELIIGTNEGYYVFNLPKMIPPNNVNFDIEVNELLINNQKIRRDAYNWFNLSLKYLDLKHKQNNISLDFKTLNHPYPSKLSYKYQIKGLDTVWSNYSNKTNIFLHYLPPGKYDILVKTKDLNSGQQYLNNLMTIKVNPPYWYSPWFIALVLFNLTVIGAVIYKVRVNKIKQKEINKSVVQNRLTEIKLEALQSQMNPHFTFNAMNSIQNYIIDNDIDNALMYLGEFAKLIRQTLDNCACSRIKLDNAINYLDSYIKLENMRFGNRVAVKINYVGLDVMNIMIPPMIIQPLVENVFIHAFDKDSKNPQLTIDFSIVDGRFQIKIIDNGKGIVYHNSQKMHKSKGMKLIKERLKLLNNSDDNIFKISSNEEGGTTIKIVLELVSFNDYITSQNVHIR